MAYVVPDMKPGAFIEYTDPEMVWRCGPWGTMSVVSKDKEMQPPPLKTPSVFWECTGIYTVYVLGCVLAYLLCKGAI